MADQINLTITLAELYEDQNQLLDALLIYQKIKSRNPSEKLDQKIEILQKKIFAKNPENYNPIIDKIFSPEDKTRFKILSHTQYQAFIKSQKISVDDDLPPLGKAKSQLKLPQDKEMVDFIEKTARSESEVVQKEIFETSESETIDSQLPYIDAEELEKIKSAEKEDKVILTKVDQDKKDEKRVFLYDEDDRDGHFRDDFFTTPFEAIRKKSKHNVDLSEVAEKDAQTERNDSIKEVFSAQETGEKPEIPEFSVGDSNQTDEWEREVEVVLTEKEVEFPEKDIYPEEMQPSQVEEESIIEEITLPGREDLVERQDSIAEKELLPEDKFDLSNLDLEEMLKTPEESEPIKAEAEFELKQFEAEENNREYEALKAAEEFSSPIEDFTEIEEVQPETEADQQVQAEVISEEPAVKDKSLEELEAELKAEFQVQRKEAEKALKLAEEQEIPVEIASYEKMEEPEIEEEEMEPAAFAEDKITSEVLEKILKSNKGLEKKPEEIPSQRTEDFMGLTFFDVFPKIKDTETSEAAVELDEISGEKPVDNVFEEPIEPEPVIESQLEDMEASEESVESYSKALLDDFQDIEPEIQEVKPPEPVAEEMQPEEPVTEEVLDIKEEIISSEQTVEDDLSYEESENIEPVDLEDITREESVEAAEEKPFLPVEIMADSKLITSEEFTDDFQAEPEQEEGKKLVDFGEPESEYLPITNPPKDAFFAASFDSILKRFAPDEEEEIADLPKTEPEKNEEKLEDLNFQAAEISDIVEPEAENSAGTVKSQDDISNLSFDDLITTSQAGFRKQDLGFKAEDILPPEKKKKK